ncbi:MAG TPA: hypothetical protein VEK11_17210 [Thermoanaerobaculia bacterium]|jgi:hypothetical protein|nr:hypothetical protein [Thermoanaerobaculia bacterium]
MRTLDLNDRVLDKLAHIAQLAAEIRRMVEAERPDEMGTLDPALAKVEDVTHRLSRQLTQVPLGMPRN